MSSKRHSHHLVLVRHGETAWSLSRQHTGHTDLPLLEEGRRMAEALAAPLRAWRFSAVWTSPLQRARETCERAGYGHLALERAELKEWGYGAYEGKTKEEIRQEHPEWNLWVHGVPGGETVEQVGARADRILEEAMAVGGHVVLFSHSHLLRILTARWLGLPPLGGRHFTLNTGAISVLGYDADGVHPIIHRWNDTRHLG